MKRIIAPLACLICAMVGAYIGTSLAQDDDPFTYPHYVGSAYYMDVAAGSAHDEDIGYAREAGIIRGYTDDIYGPADAVSREQMATFEMRDVAFGLVVGLRMAEWYHGLQPWMPDMPLPIDEEFQRDAQLFRWAADVIDHQAAARPDDAVWGPELYAHTSTCLNFVADALASGEAAALLDRR